MQTTVCATVSYFDGLLADTQCAALHESLTNVVRRAVEVWHPIQRAKQKFEVDFDAAGDDLVPFEPTIEMQKAANEINGTNNQNSTNGDIQPHWERTALTVFPRLLVIDTAEFSVYTPAVQLTRSQLLWTTAED